MAREKIGLGDSMKDLILKMSEGNPGAVNVLLRLLEDDPVMGPMVILHLDDMNIRGSQIWVAYKDFCREELSKFKEAVFARNSEMVAKVNEVCSYAGEVAVPGGASFERSK